MMVNEYNPVTTANIFLVTVLINDMSNNTSDSVSAESKHINYVLLIVRMNRYKRGRTYVRSLGA